MGSSIFSNALQSLTANILFSMILVRYKLSIEFFQTKCVLNINFIFLAKFLLFLFKFVDSPKRSKLSGSLKCLSHFALR